MSTVAVARYRGICHQCGGRWEPGDEIRPVWPPTRPRKWEHSACPEDEDDLALRAGEAVCQDCFLVHPEGACDW